MSTISISGIVTTLDKYGRMRILIDSYEDMHKIMEVCKCEGRYIKTPYTLFNEKNGNAQEGLYGECIIVLKAHKEFWKKKISEERGKKINIEEIRKTGYNNFLK